MWSIFSEVSKCVGTLSREHLGILRKPLMLHNGQTKNTISLELIWKWTAVYVPFVEDTKQIRYKAHILQTE